MANHEHKLTPERWEQILGDLRKGNTRACAAERAGICERTLRGWVSRGKQGEAPFAAFFAGLKKAERDAERRAVGVIRRAGRTSWQAMAWWLERKFPESWSANTEIMREIVAAYRKRKKAKPRA